MMEETFIIKESSGELKALARMALKDLWLDAAIGMFIYQLLVNGIPSLIAAFFPALNYIYTDPQTGMSVNLSPFTNIYRFLLIGPLVVGMNNYVLRIIRKREVDNMLLLSGFGIFLKSFFLRLLIGIFITLWILPVSLGVTLIGASVPSIATFGFTIILAVAVWAYVRYSMATFILADHPKISILEAVKESKNRMKYNTSVFILLIISFLGWLILGSIPAAVCVYFFSGTSQILLTVIRIIADIPICFVTIYMYVTEGFFYEILVGNIKKIGDGGSHPVSLL